MPNRLRLFLLFLFAILLVANITSGMLMACTSLLLAWDVFLTLKVFMWIYICVSALYVCLRLSSLVTSNIETVVVVMLSFLALAFNVWLYGEALAAV